VASIKLLCSSNSEHQDELARTTDKNTGGFYEAVGLTCPTCDATVGYSMLTDSPNADFIKEGFEELMKQAGGCPCCKPSLNLTVNV
jgi:hypothetical protein